MNYELAKKLKGASFPHKWVLEYDGSLRECAANVDITLSELIKECRNEFTHLKQLYGDFGWEAFYNGEEVRDDQHYFFGKGPTPEEAVANLWLATHTQEKV